MRVLNVQITENEILQFGINAETLTFEDLLKSIKRQIAKDALRRSTELAAQSGLSKMTSDEIDAEVQAARKEKRDASNHH